MTEFFRNAGDAAPAIVQVLEEARQRRRFINSYPYLIFVTDSRTVSVEKKSVMWRNYKFLYMTNVEKSKIHPHVD